MFQLRTTIIKKNLAAETHIDTKVGKMVQQSCEWSNRIGTIRGFQSIRTDIYIIKKYACEYFFLQY